MRCPKCGKDVELQNKQVGVDENGKPILNAESEYHGDKDMYATSVTATRVCITPSCLLIK